ncbi:hypothetical protein R6Q59_023624 [Mikania micrantha]
MIEREKPSSSSDALSGDISGHQQHLFLFRLRLPPVTHFRAKLVRRSVTLRRRYFTSSAPPTSTDPGIIVTSGGGEEIGGGCAVVVGVAVAAGEDEWGGGGGAVNDGGGWCGRMRWLPEEGL